MTPTDSANCGTPSLSAFLPGLLPVQKVPLSPSWADCGGILDLRTTTEVYAVSCDQVRRKVFREHRAAALYASHSCCTGRDNGMCCGICG